MTKEEALKLAQAWVRENHPHFTVGGLLQDDEDYKVQLSSDDAEPIMGPGFIFISKTDALVWTTAPAGDAVRKMQAMTEVAL